LHPVALTQIILVLLFHDLLVPHLSLQRSRIFVGDVLDAGDPARIEPLHGAWMSASKVPGKDAIRVEPAALRLNFYTGGLEKPEQPYAYLSLEALLRDRMPPLEDLIVGGHPGAMGTGCAIAVIMGGLFMLYRGVIDYRIPLLTVVAAYAALMILPVPIAIRQFSREWHWLAIHQPTVGPALAVTFANYEIMAGPLLFVAFFLATSPSVRPLTRRSRALYALLIGVIAAALQLYVSVSLGPYLALLAVGLISPMLDRWFKPRTLV
jgi:Na+-transporting NADH:ubiquinone oxidoreductase subunit NqrB